MIGWFFVFCFFLEVGSSIFGDTPVGCIVLWRFVHLGVAAFCYVRQIFPDVLSGTVAFLVSILDKLRKSVCVIFSGVYFNLSVIIGLAIFYGQLILSRIIESAFVYSCHCSFIQLINIKKVLNQLLLNRLLHRNLVAVK